MLKFDGAAEFWAQRSNGFVQDSFPFELRVMLLRIWSVIDDFERRVFGTRVVAGYHGGLQRAAPLAKNHQRGINGDARQPGGKRGPFVKVLEMDEGAQESILQSILRVFAISGDTKCRLVKLSGIGLAKGTESRRLASFGRSQQRFFTHRGFPQ